MKNVISATENPSSTGIFAKMKKTVLVTNNAKLLGIATDVLSSFAIK